MAHNQLPKRPLVVAGASGGATDKLRALTDLAQLPQIDVIVGDWMSEANMTVRGVEWAGIKAKRAGLNGHATDSAVYLSNTQDAYDPYFLQQLKPALPHLAKNGIKLACNAGGSNPGGLAEAVKELLDELHLDLKVAWVEGDDVSDQVFGLSKQGKAFKSIITDKDLKEWDFEPICAQCYLGGTGVARAFEAGADIIICGRIADASACVGACMWWHGWDRETDLDKMAGGLIAGHLTECSTYVTGGCFAGFKSFGKKYLDLACPIAYIDENGDIELTMEESRDGEVSFGTVASQLLYEIQGPLYYNSDVIAKMEGLRIKEIGPNRVRITGAEGLPAPETTKVGISAKGGWRAEFHYYLTGLDIAEKAEMIELQTKALMAEDIKKFRVLTFQTAGSVPEDPQSQDEATVDFRIFAQSDHAEVLAADKFLVWCKQNLLQSYPGGTPNTDVRQAVGKPYYEYFVTMLEQEHVAEKAHLPDGTIVDMPPPTRTSTYSRDQPSYDTTNPVPLDSFGPTKRVPMGYIVHARSGDKASDANVGFFVRHDDEWDWLRSLLSIAKMKELLGRDYTGKPVDRFEMPGIRGVHFLLRDHLQGGYNSSAGFDSLGKNLCEYIRAKRVEVPTRFLDRGRI